jgi:hypothetical protein
VYALIDPRDNQVRYVGKSVDVKARVRAHLNESGTTDKNQWLQELGATGREPEAVVLEQGSGEWEHVEMKWIAYYRSMGCNLTNRTAGGFGLLDAAPQTRALLAEIQREIWSNPELREKRLELYASQEWRDAVSAALKGKPHWWNGALPQNQKGYPWSAEVRAKRRAILLAKAVPAAARAENAGAARPYCEAGRKQPR